MKQLYFIGLLLILFSCNNEKVKETIPVINDPYEALMKEKKTDSFLIIDSIWINEFKDFRNAIYQNDLQRLNKYIDSNLTKETWFLIDNKNYSSIDKPFTKKDFQKLYTKVFDKPFITSLLSIKTSDLYERDCVFSSKPSIINRNIYKAVLSREKHKNNFSICIFKESLDIPREIDQPMIGCEGCSQMYYFEIDTNSHLKFKGINLAG